MKFIIDENLSPELVPIFREAGLNAWHINEFKSNPKQRIIDDQLRKLSIRKGYIIVTKDDDFVRSFVHRKVPERMIYIHGLETKKVLLARLKEVIIDLSKYCLKCDFIEVNEKELRFPFD